MNSSVRRQRNEELTDLFLSVLGSGGTSQHTMEQCAAMPCSRFWIEPEYALRLIKAKTDGGATVSQYKARHAVKRGNTERKIEEIIRRCDGDFSLANIARVVFSPAPEFYISGRTAQAVITRTLKERRKHGIH